MQTEKIKSPKWVLMGLFWGLFMFVMMAIVTPVAEGVQLKVDKVLMSLLLWMVGGLIYGYITHLVNRKK